MRVTPSFVDNGNKETAEEVTAVYTDTILLFNETNVLNPETPENIVDDKKCKTCKDTLENEGSWCFSCNGRVFDKCNDGITIWKQEIFNSVNLWTFY